MRLLTILFIASLFTASCTIQKRTFRNGYYVSWNKSALKEKAKHEKSVLEEQPTTEIAFKDSVFSDKQEEELVLANETFCETTINPTKDFVNEPDSTQEKDQTTISSEMAIRDGSDEVITKPVIMKKDLRESLETNEKRPNLFAINSLVFAIGYVILSFITIFTNLFALAVICFVIALTFAIIAIRKWKHRRDDFWGTFFAIIALGLLVLGTLILLLFILAGSL